MPLARSYFLVCAASCLASVAGAQGRPAAAAQRQGPRWEIPGLDITPNGGWRVRARAVAATRSRFLVQRNFALLNAAPAGPAAVNAVVGTLRVPVVMFRYQDSPSALYSRDTAQYNAALFGTVPPAGRAYTLRTFYEQLSNGLFSIQGAAAGWEPLSGNESAYTGVAGTCPGNPYGTNNCNGVWSTAASTAMLSGLQEALTHADSTIDFGQYDNDGPDGIPNSNDDDGVVDAVLFLHPSLDGACLDPTNNHLWSHRFSLNNFATNDAATPGPNKASSHVLVRDYILQSGLGSSLPSGSPCGTEAIMPVGTAAHELGHILALPDLYDVSGSTEGIGEFGLMGSGNYTTGNSPSRYDPWSLQQMGWTTVVPLTTTGTYRVGPVPTADTVFYVSVQGTNPRDEYFLIENRQEVLSDSAMLRVHCGLSGNAPGCTGGLLIYHVDGLKACLIPCGGSVNAGPIHGVAIEEADRLRNLWNGDNRGDGGDLYPGTTDNTALGFRTSPAATKNSDTSFAGFAVDSIRQVPNGEMAFRLRFGGLTSVAASDTAAMVQVDGQPYNVFQDLFDEGSSHTIAVADTQYSWSVRTRFTFQSWSDGGLPTHQITGQLAGTTYTATLVKSHRLDASIRVTGGGSGTVSYNPPEDSAGTFVPSGTSVTLTGTPGPSMVFAGWTGDTTAASATLVLPMLRPYAVQANFTPPLAITSSDPRPVAIMAKAYVDSLQATGGGSGKHWSIVGGTLPPGLILQVGGGITGAPTQIGVYTFTARVSYLSLVQQQQFSITVTAPTLAVSAVLAQLLTGTSSLTSEDIQYLDLIGNRSCRPGIGTANCFDVGDFLAWVEATGVQPAAALVERPPRRAAAPRRGGRP